LPTPGAQIKNENLHDAFPGKFAIHYWWSMFIAT
jgi:hypothetical protein